MPPSLMRRPPKWTPAGIRRSSARARGRSTRPRCARPARPGRADPGALPPRHGARRPHVAAKLRPGRPQVGRHGVDAARFGRTHDAVEDDVDYGAFENAMGDGDGSINAMVRDGAHEVASASACGSSDRRRVLARALRRLVLGPALEHLFHVIPLDDVLRVGGAPLGPVGDTLRAEYKRGVSGMFTCLNVNLSLPVERSYDPREFHDFIE